MTIWGPTIDDWYIRCNASEKRSIARRPARLKRRRDRVAGAVLLAACVLVAVKW